MIVVFDCNIWISLALNNQIDFIAELFDSGVIVASCSELRSEITGVLNRPKFKKYITSPYIEKIVQLHDQIVTTYKPGKIVNVTSDIKDDYLFALCVKAKADYFVTGDKILLDVRLYKKTKLLSLSEFKQIAGF